jgi:hypothetical protein
MVATALADGVRPSSAHRRARIGVRGGLLHAPERHAGVKDGRDRVPEPVRLRAFVVPCEPT